MRVVNAVDLYPDLAQLSSFPINLSWILIWQYISPFGSILPLTLRLDTAFSRWAKLRGEISSKAVNW
jgi:hypothetical protein